MKKLFLIILCLVLFTGVAHSELWINDSTLAFMMIGDNQPVADGCVGGADGYIGQEVSVGNNDAGANAVMWTEFTPDETEDGDVTFCHFIVDFSQNDHNVGIWNDSGELQVDGTGVAGGNSNAEQIDITLDEAYCLVADTTYWLGMAVWGSDENYNFDEDNAAGGSAKHYDTSSPPSGDTLGNISSDGTVSTNNALIWCDNSPT